jgi:hypothetical protein
MSRRSLSTSRQIFKRDATGQPKGRFRGPLETLLRRMGAVDKSVVAKGSLLPGRLCEPDYAVLVAGAMSGSVELESPGHGANSEPYEGHDRDR